jgi:hypothetical protein
MTKSHKRRGVFAAVCALAAIAVPTASASLGGTLQAPVGTLLGTASACQGRVLSQPFSSWGDRNLYFPVAGGTFEQGAPGWAVAGGASVAPGGNTLLPDSHGGALALPNGASATTPGVCVDAASPTVRFFVQGSGRVIVSSLIAGVWLPLGQVSAGSSWAPSQAFLNIGSLLGLLSMTGTATAEFRFTAAGGPVRVDDVYVDPYRRT